MAGGETMRHWLWQFPGDARQAWLRNGVSKKSLYCPAMESADTDSLWGLGSHTSSLGGGRQIPLAPAIGYIWLSGGSFDAGLFFDREIGRQVTTKPAPISFVFEPGTGKVLHPQTPVILPASEIELMADLVVSMDGSFSNPWSLGMGLSTAHMKGATPAGGNILFLDGHIGWRDFSEMHQRNDVDLQFPVFRSDGTETSGKLATVYWF